MHLHQAIRTGGFHIRLQSIAKTECDQFKCHPWRHTLCPVCHSTCLGLIPWSQFIAHWVRFQSLSQPCMRFIAHRSMPQRRELTSQQVQDDLSLGAEVAGSHHQAKEAPPAAQLSGRQLQDRGLGTSSAHSFLLACAAQRCSMTPLLHLCSPRLAILHPRQIAVECSVGRCSVDVAAA